MRISDCSSDVCSSDLLTRRPGLRDKSLSLAGKCLFPPPDKLLQCGQCLLFPSTDPAIHSFSSCRLSIFVCSPNRSCTKFRISAVRWITFARRLSSKRRIRSEEHTSELQSLMRISYAVFCLKKNKPTQHDTI